MMNAGGIGGSVGGGGISSNGDGDDGEDYVISCFFFFGI